MAVDMVLLMSGLLVAVTLTLVVVMRYYQDKLQRLRDDVEAAGHARRRTAIAASRLTEWAPFLSRSEERANEADRLLRCRTCSQAPPPRETGRSPSCGLYFSVEAPGGVQRMPPVDNKKTILLRHRFDSVPQSCARPGRD